MCIWFLCGGSLCCLVLGKIQAPSSQLLRMCSVIDQQQQKIFLISYLCIVMSNIEPLSAALYGNIILF